MCGIIGAIGKRNISPILVEGLKRMEYRGYDSAGLAVIGENNTIERVRTQGKVNELVEALQQHPLKSTIGIAHTRWATHGKPSETNAHPHVSGEGDHMVAVVHNGIIENYQEIKDALKQNGYVFRTETDTEVIAHLIHQKIQVTQNLVKAVQLAIKEFRGTYALGILSGYAPGTLIAVRSGSPMVIGLGFDENYFASDHLALMPVTQQFMYLEEGDVAELTLHAVNVYNVGGEKVERAVKTITGDSFASLERGPYRHYMQKEIFEQPKALSATLEGRLQQDHVVTTMLGKNSEQWLKTIKHVHIVACGTSFHAGLVGRHWIESETGIACHVEIASEYRYRKSVVPPDTLFIAISQSGETADTLAALRHAKQASYVETLAISNMSESTMVREAGSALLTHAGPEIGVASTKAFTTQLLALRLLTLSLARGRAVYQSEIEAQHVQALRELPVIAETILDEIDKPIKQLAKLFTDKKNAIFLGRGEFYPIACEGALKLKEISYIHAEAYPAGELKHGPLALIDKEIPIVALVPNTALKEKMLSNLEEVRARGGQLIIVTDGDFPWDEKNIIKITIPSKDQTIYPLLYTLPLQLLAYHVAVLKGTDVDQPRHLAKSVTVE